MRIYIYTYVHLNINLAHWCLRNACGMLFSKKQATRPTNSGRVTQRSSKDTRSFEAPGMQTSSATAWRYRYPWWKKSCTTWHVWNLINSGVNYIPINWCRISSINGVCQSPFIVLRNMFERRVFLKEFSGLEHLAESLWDAYCWRLTRE